MELAYFDLLPHSGQRCSNPGFGYGISSYQTIIIGYAQFPRFYRECQPIKWVLLVHA